MRRSPVLLGIATTGQAWHPMKFYYYEKKWHFIVTLILLWVIVGVVAPWPVLVLFSLGGIAALIWLLRIPAFDKHEDDQKRLY